MKSQSNSQSELDGLLGELLGHDDGVAIGNGYHDDCAREIAEAKAKLLQLWLSCLPEKYDSYTGTDMEDYQKGHNAAIDTMERNIKERFS